MLRVAFAEIVVDDFERFPCNIMFVVPLVNVRPVLAAFDIVVRDLPIRFKNFSTAIKKNYDHLGPADSPGLRYNTHTHSIHPPQTGSSCPGC